MKKVLSLYPGSETFGNIYCFENIEKSILIDTFTSMGHMMRTNQKAFDNLATHMTGYAVEPKLDEPDAPHGRSSNGQFPRKRFLTIKNKNIMANKNVIWCDEKTLSKDIRREDLYRNRSKFRGWI